ncbi:MAG: histidinol-phosphate transaminase [Balneolales bacterium]
MKKFNLHNLVRPNIRNLQPYRCARDDFDSGILLDANENSFGSLIASDLDLNRYPDPYQNKLRDGVAAFRGLQQQQVFLGSGSDEAIDLIIRVFCEPGKDAVLITPPTYGMYKVSASINDNPVIQVPLSPQFQLRTRDILQKVTPSTKVIFLCSPNNPTANLLDREDMKEILANFGGIVVIDEAYIDFSGKDTMVSDLNAYPNLIVLQTFSKAFGMAGTRLGIALASPEIIRVLFKIKAPYNVNKLTARAGLQALDRLGEMRRTVAEILAERTRLAERLETLAGIKKIFPTDANFILIRVDHALDTYTQLAGRGVIVRYRGDQVHCEETLRITVGTPEENDALIRNLKEILS